MKKWTPNLLFNKLKTIFQLFVFVAGILFSNNLVFADQDRDLPTILQSASELDYPPFAIVRPDGTADGFSVELLKAVVQAADLEVNISVGPWHEIKQQLAEGRLDVLPLVAYSRDRDKVYDFTNPYLQMHGTIFVRKGEKSIHTEADLQDKAVVVMRDDSSHEYALNNNITTKLILTTTFEEALSLLSSGKHDAVLCQYLVGLQLIKKLGIKNIVPIDTKYEESLKPKTRNVSGFEQKFCIAVPEGRKELLAHLNEGLAIVVANGTYNELYTKWFGPILPRPTIPLATIIKFVIFSLVPILLVIAVVGIWYLKKEVARQTKTLNLEIKERKQAEKELGKSNDRYYQMTANLPGLVYQFVLHANGSYSMPYISEGVQKMFGVSSYEVNQDIHSIMQFMHPDDVLDFEHFLADSAESLSPYNHEFRALIKGMEVWINCRSRPKRLANGDILWNGIMLDVTERKIFEKMLVENKAFTTAVLDNLPIGIAVNSVEPTVSFTYMNDNFPRFYRTTRNELEDPNAFWTVVYEDPEFRREIKKRIIDDCVSGDPERMRWEDIPITRKGKEPLFISAMNTPVPEKNLMISAVWDVTSRKKMEGEKAKLEERLQQAQKMEAIGTLAGGIAHDFNNILGAILGYADLAKQDAPPGTRFQEDLDNVLISAKRATDLVKQILAFSRQSQVERIPMKLQPLIKEGLKMLRSSIPTTISITEDIDPQSGITLVDPTQIHQILMNLCTNAYQAMEETGGTLSVSLKTTVIGSDGRKIFNIAPGEYVEVTVSDTGVGIAPDVIGKIFEPYFTTKGLGKGTGMGLAIIHGIMQECGGMITVESALGKGSTFHVYFPVIEEEALPDIKEEEDIPGGKERVLFIDDEELLAEMCKDMLERLGYHVTVRCNSLEALTTFQNSPDEFDIIITDMTMPYMTGSDLARRMIQIRPDIPVILCTGYSNLINEHSAKAMGIKEFTLKPLTTNVLAKLIRKILDGEKQG